MEGFNSHLNVEQMNKALISLAEMYNKAAAEGRPQPNGAPPRRQPGAPRGPQPCARPPRRRARRSPRRRALTSRAAPPPCGNPQSPSSVATTCCR
jgi:hypothetical protein